MLHSVVSQLLDVLFLLLGGEVAHVDDPREAGEGGEGDGERLLGVKHRLFLVGGVQGNALHYQAVPHYLLQLADNVELLLQLLRI